VAVTVNAAVRDCVASAGCPLTDTFGGVVSIRNEDVLTSVWFESLRASIASV
jgi:hypothetical protein